MTSKVKTRLEKVKVKDRNPSINLSVKNGVRLSLRNGDLKRYHENAEVGEIKMTLD